MIVLGCALPGREVHAPLEYSGSRLACSGIDVEVVDARVAVTDLSPGDTRQLIFPSSFEARARERLGTMVGGEGPELRVVTRVAAADELELVDARGEVTRVVVTLAFDVHVKDGPMLRRAEAQSRSDIPRDEATDDEIAFVLEATARNAFDRYWASATTVNGLNREIAAYIERHGAPAP